jgi:DNA processing protein
MKIKRITFNEYPLLLRQIFNPPKFLDIAGAPIPSDDHKFLCVVGARDYTQYGEETCRHLIKGLQGYPIVIVSGLAIGIDSIAHEQALACGLHTISVPGSGLDEHSIYPHSHINLARRIIASGNTLLSPFELTQQSAIWTFPTRNRIMAGLCHATLVIEGRIGSGTLITAEHALGFNRDVYIVPGSIFSETTYAPHLLYKDGAIPVTNSREILENLELEKPLPPEIPPKKIRRTINTAKSPSTSSPSLSSQPQIPLLPEELAIITVLKSSSQTTSSLIELTGLSPVKISIVLSQLELKDLIVNDAGTIKIKTW